MSVQFYIRGTGEETRDGTIDVARKAPGKARRRLSWCIQEVRVQIAEERGRAPMRARIGRDPLFGIRSVERTIKHGALFGPERAAGLGEHHFQQAQQCSYLL